MRPREGSLRASSSPKILLPPPPRSHSVVALQGSLSTHGTPQPQLAHCSLSLPFPHTSMHHQAPTTPHHHTYQTSPRHTIHQTPPHTSPFTPVRREGWAPLSAGQLCMQQLRAALHKISCSCMMSRVGPACQLPGKPDNARCTRWIASSGTAAGPMQQLARSCWLAGNLGWVGGAGAAATLMQPWVAPDAAMGGWLARRACPPAVAQLQLLAACLLHQPPHVALVQHRWGGGGGGLLGLLRGGEGEGHGRGRGLPALLTNESKNYITNRVGQWGSPSRVEPSAGPTPHWIRGAPPAQPLHLI